MRKKESGVKVLNEAREKVRQGIPVVVWVSLPCAAWCSWQRVNMTQSSATFAKIVSERQREQGHDAIVV
eukprot:11539778-Heterocapsa_arctica.AAC.1